MKNKKHKNINEEMINKIISVAYNDASIKDRLSVYIASKKSDEVLELYKEYKTTAKSVHYFGIEECPDELLDISIQKIEKKRNREKSFWFDIYTALFTRPILSAIATVLVLVAMITSLLFYTPASQNGYSNEEIELANKQVKYALSLVKSAFNKSNHILKEDILTNKVAKPIGDGINYFNKLLMEEK